MTYNLSNVYFWHVSSRDVTTKLSLGGNNDVITELFLPRGSLVSDIPAGDGKLVNLFLRCRDHRLRFKERTQNTVCHYLAVCVYFIWRIGSYCLMFGTKV
jgi:hypothetical protein